MKIAALRPVLLYLWESAYQCLQGSFDQRDLPRLARTKLHGLIPGPLIPREGSSMFTASKKLHVLKPHHIQIRGRRREDIAFPTLGPGRGDC